MKPVRVRNRDRKVPVAELRQLKRKKQHLLFLAGCEFKEFRGDETPLFIKWAFKFPFDADWQYAGRHETKDDAMHAAWQYISVPRRNLTDSVTMENSHVDQVDDDQASTNSTTL